MVIAMTPENKSETNADLSFLLLDIPEITDDDELNIEEITDSGKLSLDTANVVIII